MSGKSYLCISNNCLERTLLRQVETPIVLLYPAREFIIQLMVSRRRKANMALLQLQLSRLRECKKMCVYWGLARDPKGWIEGWKFGPHRGASGIGFTRTGSVNGFPPQWREG